MTTYKATHITNFDAKPPLTVNARLHGGVVKEYKDAFTKRLIMLMVTLL